MKKCVAIFVSTIGAGGTEKQAALLAKALSGENKVLFIALYGDYEPSKRVVALLEESKAEVHLLTGSWRKRIFCFGKLLKHNDVHYLFNYLTQCDFWGAIVGRLCGVSRIYNGIRNSELEKYKVALEFVSHNFISNGSIFNCFSGEEVFVSKGFKKNKSRTIPNCFVDITSPFRRDETAVKNIITIGRFVPQKDYKTAIQAISELKKKRNDFIFNIVGYGDLEDKIREWVALYGVDDVVKFHVNSKIINELLIKSDVYLSTSLFEGTSNSIMEAMNVCLPVVATNVGDNSYLVSDKNSGYLHDVGDFRGLASSMDCLLSNIELRNKMGICGNKILREKYSFDIFKARYLKVLTE